MTCYKGLGGEGNCTNFFTYIKATLILYIMTFDMMFLLGMVKISQTDLVIRIVKIAFVMNDSTFKFFNTGVASLMSLILPQSFRIQLLQICLGIVYSVEVQVFLTQ